MTSPESKRAIDKLRGLYTTAQAIQGTAQTLTALQNRSLRLQDVENSCAEGTRDFIGIGPVDLTVLPQGSSCTNPEDLFKQGVEVGPVTCTGFSTTGEDGKWQANFSFEGVVPFSVPVELIKVTDPITED